ncbi:Hypothetical predicted protein [Cloeon dipterum]|uniref:Uncharacterized protein n=1 Tax=Cloeon dipterum TaxID=197152 RepID=A0A8S1CAT2_9INSE|nr:Hypothetical predicted protein [Cloeon dipterum]
MYKVQFLSFPPASVTEAKLQSPPLTIVCKTGSIEELCQKDKLLEDQRKIIVEIRIKLDEKHKELEELRQSLDSQDSTVDWLEAEKQQLQQRLLEADVKLEKSVKAVQTLVSRNQELAARVDQIGSTTSGSTSGAN